jgi:acyl carrier protein
MLNVSKDVCLGLTEIFQDIFRRPDLVLSDGLSSKDVRGWDSFKHIEIIMVAEAKWAIKFDADDLDELRCVGDLAQMIARKTAGY